MNEKLCCACNNLLPLSLFSLKRGKPNAQCKQCKYTKDAEYRSMSKEKIALRNAKYWQSSKGTEKQIKRNSSKCKTYREKNKQLFCLYAANYRAQKLQATPKWANFFKIQQMYEACPEGYHVDHVIPLCGKFVCGLHVETNLQYLSAKENLQKSNKHEV